MDTRRDFIKKASLLSSGAGLLHVLPLSIQKAMSIDPAPGSTYLDAEHIVFLMQENRSFDHTYGSLQGVRGFNDPRAIRLPNENLVWLQSNKAGDTYSPFRLDIKNTKSTWMSSLPHSWGNQVDARNGGKYDKWLDTKHSGNEDYAAMPLTLGFYTREDIPFYYSLADAFTVCDQNFCSSLTGTTPNRLYFWTGTIREKSDEKVKANVWNEDADHYTNVNWTTFPERLEDNGISWKIYQNELYLNVGFEGEEEAWLSNFGDNPIEYFSQYKVKLSAAYIANLPAAAIKLAAEIKKREEQLIGLTAGSKEAQQVSQELDWYKKQLVINQEDQKVYTREKYEQLSTREKNLHDKAFSTNKKDPFYHQLTTLNYKDGTTEREMKIPKGDVLHQFREDVKNGTLPTVSWIAAPESFSDHPSSAWYGAWYISEVMDILTQNPEVWKKTIFVLTYDENDGYFDHIPPFVAPHPHNKDTGKTSEGISTGTEYVADKSQQSISEYARESPIGLGYRVPMVIASPWSRGGWVCSQVFDHTSSLQFLEKFLSHKSGKKIAEPNITEWRRAVCGDLTSAFRPYNGERINKPIVLPKNKFLESIHQARFKKTPSNFKKLTTTEIAQINKNPRSSAFMPDQEKGIRSSCALPYELYVNETLDRERRSLSLQFVAGNKFFGTSAAGSPFQAYVPGVYQQEKTRVWDFTVASGTEVKENWPLNHFENNLYHLRVYGPNGFYREFAGDIADPNLSIKCGYESSRSGRLSFMITNNSDTPITADIIDNSYKTAKRTFSIKSSQQPGTPIMLDTTKSFGWYDFTIKFRGYKNFERRYAGRVENGKPGMTDPFMGAST